MIGHAAGCDQYYPEIVGDSQQASVELLLQGFGNEIPPIFGAEHAVYEIGGVGLWHGVPSVRDLLALVMGTQHSRAGLMNAVPFGDSCIVRRAPLCQVNAGAGRRS